MKKLLILLALLLLPINVMALTANTTLYSIEDTYTYQALPTNTFGNNVNLVVKEIGGLGQENAEIAFLKFSLKNISLTKTPTTNITNATLCIFEVAQTGGITTKVYNSSNQTWLENQIYWNNQPANGNDGIRFYAPTNNNWNCIDVTNTTKIYLDAGYENVTYILDPRDGFGYSSGFTFVSKENVTKIPYLNVSYTTDCWKSDDSNYLTQDLTVTGTCKDVFGTYTDSCYDVGNPNLQFVYEYECGWNYVNDYCTKVIQQCPSGTICLNGACKGGYNLTIANNKDGCAVYVPKTGRHAYPYGTNVSVNLYKTSDCLFEYWFIEPNVTQNNATEINISMTQNYNFTAVWVGGDVTTSTGGQQSDDVGGGKDVGVTYINPFFSGYFLLGAINLGIAGVAVWLAKDTTHKAEIGIMTFFVVFLALLFSGYYPSILFVPVFIGIAIIVTMIMLKIPRGDNNS